MGSSGTATGVGCVSSFVRTGSSVEAPVVCVLGEQKCRIERWMAWQIAGLEAFATLDISS